jgi:PAS domain S-box-containing protein
MEQAFQKGFTVPLDMGTLQKMSITGTTIVVSDTTSHAEWTNLPETAWIRSYIGAPIQIHDRVAGFLNLSSKTPSFFTQVHAERLQAFADQAAIALENAQLYDNIQNHAEELEQRVSERTAELNHAKERVETILNNSSDLVILLSNEGIIQQVNPAFNKMYRCESGQSIGQPITSLAALGSAGPLMATLHAAVEYQQPLRLEIVAQYNDSAAFDADVAFSPIVQENGQVSGIVCSMRDITLFKRSEANLRQMLAKQTELSELKSRFINTASHEFRTPLAIIQASSETLQRYHDRLSEEQKRKKFDQIQVNIKNITALLDDVLAFSQAQEGKLEFNPVLLDAEAFCRSRLEDFEKLYNGEHTFIFSHTGNRVNLSLDPNLLRRIVGNLLSNAAKYSPSGSTVVFDLLVHDTQVILQIKDEGIGIPLADQERLFEPFHRAKNVGAIRGNGLGLAIVKQAVDLHGGAIQVESVEGIGTTFIVNLPLNRIEITSSP